MAEADKIVNSKKPVARGNPKGSVYIPVQLPSGKAGKKIGGRVLPSERIAGSKTPVIRKKR